MSSAFRITAKYKENVNKNIAGISNSVTINHNLLSDQVNTSSEESTTCTDENGVTVTIPSSSMKRRRRLTTSCSSSGSLESTEPESSSSSVEEPIIESKCEQESGENTTCCGRSIMVKENDPCRLLFERKLLGITLAVVSNKDESLFKAVRDKNGDVILAKEDLIDLIKILTKSDDVQLVTTDLPIKSKCLCFGKITFPIYKEVNRILVNKVNFEICFNSTFSLFNEYKITLEKVID